MKEERYKLLYLDVGLLQTATKVDATHFFDADILQINAGMIAEQFVGQELLAYEVPYQNSPLLFWERTDGGEAEVDYAITIGSDIVPVEVKAGATGSLRSMHAFLKDKKSKIGVRVSEHPLTLHQQILSLPLYMLGHLQKIISRG